MDSVCILWARLAIMTGGIFPLKFNGKVFGIFLFFIFRFGFDCCSEMIWFECFRLYKKAK